MRVRDIPAGAEPLEGRGGSPALPEQVVEFDSLSDMANYVSESEKTFRGVRTWMASTDTITRRGRLAFNQAVDVPATLELAKYGWKEGRDRAAAWYGELEKEFRKHVVSPTFLNDVHGHEVDVPSFLMGHPEHMVDYQPAQVNARAISIAVDVNVRCSACGRRWHDAAPTSPDWVLVRGAAIVMLMRVLIRAGYKPRLDMTTTTLYNSTHPWSGKSDIYSGQTFLRTIVVPAHRPSMVFDLDRVMFMSAHDSFVRRMEYRVHETLNAERWGLPRDATWGQLDRNARQWVGMLPVAESHKPSMQSRWWNPKPDIMVPSIPLIEDERGDGEDDSEFSNVSNAITWVFDTLEQSGVKLS